jgi:hypothetical protein
MICLVGGCLSLKAGAPATVELKGIVQFPKNERATTPGTQRGAAERVALIGWQTATPPQPREQSALLGEGERQGDLEVIKIEPATGTVQVRVNGEPRELTFATTNVPQQTVRHSTAGEGAPGSSGTIRLVNASWREALQIYQQLVGRTLLISSAIGEANKVTLLIDQLVPTEDLAKGIEQALDGLVFRPDGDKFTVVGREGDFEKLTPELRKVARNLTPKATAAPASQPAEPSSKPEDILPAGMLNFQNTDFYQVLQVFQELVNRTLLRPAMLPGSGITLKTQTPLTRDEAVYAMCAVLALDGISFVDLGDKFLFAYPSVLEAKRKELFARKLPSHTDAPAGAKLQMEIKDMTWLDLERLAKEYGRLLGQPVELDQNLPPRRFTLRTQTPLTAAEALYAFDLLLGWEGLEVVKSKEGAGLRMVQIH